MHFRCLLLPAEQGGEYGQRHFRGRGERTLVSTCPLLSSNSTLHIYTPPAAVPPTLRPSPLPATRRRRWPDQGFRGGGMRARRGDGSSVCFCECRCVCLCSKQADRWSVWTPAPLCMYVRNPPLRNIHVRTSIMPMHGWGYVYVCFITHLPLAPVGENDAEIPEQAGDGPGDKAVLQ